MARIPIIQDTENIDVATGRSRVRADDSAFGGLEARAMGRVAQGLGAIADVAKQKDDEFNEANAIALDNELAGRIRKRMYDRETGYLSTARGASALERQAEIEGGLQQDLSELAGTARNPRARALFVDAATRRVRGSMDSVATHVANEGRRYQTEQLEAQISEAESGAVAAWGDEAAVRSQIGTAVAAVSRAAELNGWAPEVTQARVRAVQSGVYSSVIGQMAVSDPEGAEALFERIRPSLSAQAAGELRTTMRAAQRDYVDRVEGAGWNAFAAGRPLASMGADEYRELTTNPLLGQSYARLTEAYRTRAQSYANGAGRARDNSPAYLLLLQAAMQNPDQFTQQGWLEGVLAQADSSQISGGDIARLLERRQTMQGGGPNNGLVNLEQQAYNAVRAVAAPLVGNYGLDLTPRETDDDGQSAATAFNAALMQETMAFVQQHRMLPNPIETQELIGRAIVRLPANVTRRLPAIIDRGDGREGGIRTDARRSPSRGGASVVVPYALIPQEARTAIQTRLRQQNGRMPTQGQVEALYARYLAAEAR